MPERKKDLHRLLLSKNIYIEELIEDLVIAIYKEHNKDLFNLLFNNNTSLDNFSTNYLDNEQILEWTRKTSRKGPKYNSLEKGIKNALNGLEYSEKVNFAKFITSEAPSKPKAEGKFLLQNLIENLVKLNGNNFILKLSDGEVKNLDKILDTDLLAVKEELKTEKRSRKMKTVFYAGLLFTVIFIAFFFVFYTHPTGGGGENNSSSNTTGNNTLGENNSSSNNTENNTFGENNSSSDTTGK